MKRTMRILILMLCFLTAAAAIFAAASQEDKSGPITLVVWDFKYGEAEGAGPPFKKMDEMFMEKYPDVIIEHVAQPHDQYYEIMRAAVSAGEGPDVAMFHAEQRAYVMADFMVTLDDWIEPIRSEIPDSAWIACTPNRDFADGIKMVPLTTQGLGFYYNKDLFVKAGLDPEDPPKDWDDFLAACETLKQADITPFIWGNVPAYNTNWFIRTLATNFYNNEELAGFATGETNFTDPEFVTAIKMIEELRVKEYLDPEGASIPLFMDAIDKFKNGEGAIFLGLLSDIAHWKDFNDALGKDKVGFFPNINHPDAAYSDRLVSMGAGLGLAIMSWTEHTEEAADYIMHYVSGDAPLQFVGQTGAVVPNSKIDYGALGYDLLTEILQYMQTNAVDDFVAYVPAGANNDLQAYDELLFNSQEISVEEYIDFVQASLENNR